MTNRQIKIKEKLDEMVSNGYVEIIEDEKQSVKVYKGKMNGISMYTVIGIDSFKFYINEDYLKGNRYAQLVPYRPRQYAALEAALDDIERDHRIRERNERQKQEYIRQQEEKRNAASTFKNNYFDQILNTENYKCNRGEASVLRSYSEGRDNGFTQLVINDINAWTDDNETYKEIDEILTKGEVTEFILTETSSVLMEHLDNLDQLGWKMTGMERFSYESRWERKKDVTGIRMVKVA